jgi:hypothetical protein
MNMNKRTAERPGCISNYAAGYAPGSPSPIFPADIRRARPQRPRQGSRERPLPLLRPMRRSTRRVVLIPERGRAVVSVTAQTPGAVADQRQDRGSRTPRTTVASIRTAETMPMPSTISSINPGEPGTHFPRWRRSSSLIAREVAGRQLPRGRECYSKCHSPRA